MNETRGHALSKEVLAAIAAKYGVSLAKYGSVEGGYRNISHSFARCASERESRRGGP
jgi:hypothetical protein